MKAVLGLANGGVPSDPSLFTRELAEDWRTRGVGCISTALPRPHDQLPIDVLRDLRALLADSAVRVTQFANVNANLVHPDQDVRDASVERVAAAVRPAQTLGARMILSGAGSCSPAWQDHFYGPDGENFSPEAEDRVVDSLTRIAKIISGTDMMYAVECHQLTVMRSPEVIRRILDRVNDPQVVANFDPVNLLDSAYAAYTNAERIPEMIDMMGPRYGPSCHVKDITVLPEFVYVSREVPPGKGLIALNTIFDAVAHLPGPVDLIVEHLSADDAPAAVEMVRTGALAAGIELINGC